jgi:2-methylcitrate dehydratase PrpD
VLKYVRPIDGLQAKFSATFPVAAALIDGPPVIGHFSTEGINRPELRAMMERLDVIEDPGRFYDDNLETGSVTMEVFHGDERIAIRERSKIPGTSAEPVTRGQVAAKAADCFACYRDAFGHDLPMLGQLKTIPETVYWLD